MRIRQKPFSAGGKAEDDSSLQTKVASALLGL